MSRKFEKVWTFGDAEAISSFYEAESELSRLMLWSTGAFGNFFINF